MKQCLESVQKKIDNIEEQQKIRGFRPRVLKDMRIKNSNIV